MDRKGRPTKLHKAINGTGRWKSGPFGQREKKREQEDRRGWRWDGARPAREHAEHVPDWKMQSTHKIRREVAKTFGSLPLEKPRKAGGDHLWSWG